jgi:hypothetical protein
VVLESTKDYRCSIVTGPLQLRRLRVSDRADHVTILKQADPERAAELMVSQVVAKGRYGVGYRGRIPKFKEALCPLHSPGSAGAAQGDEAWPDCGEAGAQRTRFLPCRNARGPRHHAPGQLCHTVRALHHGQYHGVAQDLALTDQRSGPKPIDRWSVRGSCWG